MKANEGIWRTAACAVSTLLVTSLAFGGPVTQERAAQEAKETARRTGTAVKDSWVTMKVHSQFIPENALEGSDIDVDTSAGVVTLTGTVPTDAGRARAIAIAKATDGVKNVVDKLRIGRAGGDIASSREAGRAAGAEAREAGREAGAAAREAGREAGAGAREAGREAGAAARDAGRSAGETAGTAGRTITDGWIKSKIYAQFITEDGLDDADIDLDIEKGVVTMNGTVPTDAARARAVALAKGTDGVKTVNTNLKVAK
jgi:hyperosmotically inducible protein